ncbi:MAG: FxsA family protein [Pseudohongiellaceae bacterium]
MRFIFLFFIVVPLVEIMLLFEVSDHIGGLWTILLVVLTAVVGLQILKFQGFSTMLRANERLRSGGIPAQEVVEGLMLAFAGALLLTPGFITDTLGFLLLVAPLRQAAAARIIRSGVVMTLGGRVDGGMSANRPGGAGMFWRTGRKRDSRDETTVEGEYYEESGSLDENPPSDDKRDPD